MANMGMMIGWKRTLPGREAQSMKKFGEYVGYLTKLQAEKHIESFEPVLPRPHGGDLNGFFLVRGDRTKLAALRETDHFKDWEAWGLYNLDGFGVVECALGDSIAEAMTRFGKLIGT